MTTIEVPWSIKWTVRCPSCGTLATEWHPDPYRARSGWGHCHAAGCGATWRMKGKGKR